MVITLTTPDKTPSWKEISNAIAEEVKLEWSSQFEGTISTLFFTYPISIRRALGKEGFVRFGEDYGFILCLPEKVCVESIAHESTHVGQRAHGKYKKFLPSDDYGREVAAYVTGRLTAYLVNLCIVNAQDPPYSP